MAEAQPTIIYIFEIFGTIQTKETDKFFSFVENKYKKLTGNTISVNYSGVIATVTVTAEEPMTPEEMEKCRFMLENEFNKHFSSVSVEAKIK